MRKLLSDRASLYLVLAVLACPEGALAEDNSTAAQSSAPAAQSSAQAQGLTDMLAASGILASGYVAASYYHSSGYNTFHQFDVQHDTFQVDQAGLTVAYQPKDGFGAVVTLIAGEDAKILHAAEDGHGETFDLEQAYIQYATGPVTVMAGKYVTLAGAEVIAPVTNTNFSRSLLFYAEPLTHTGIRATYAASDLVSFIVGVNNGWNTTSTSYGSKTGEFGISLTPSKQVSLAAQAYIGKTPSFDANRALIDLVGTYNVTANLSLVLSYDWGRQEQIYGSSLTWNGFAGYANYAIDSQWRVSARVEHFDDADGLVTGTAQTVNEGTLTFGYSPVKRFELRVEGRYDRASRPTLIRSIVATGLGTVDKSQTEVALQGVLKF